MGRRRHGGRAIGPRLSRVTKAAGARPPPRGRREADRTRAGPRTANGERPPGTRPTPGARARQGGDAAGGGGGRRETTAAPRHHTTPPPGGGGERRTRAGRPQRAGKRRAPRGARHRVGGTDGRRTGGGGRERTRTGETAAGGQPGPGERRAGAGEERTAGHRGGGGREGGFGKPQKAPGRPRSGRPGARGVPPPEASSARAVPRHPRTPARPPRRAPSNLAGLGGGPPPPFTRPRRLSHRGRIAPTRSSSQTGPTRRRSGADRARGAGGGSPARDRHRATPSARGRCPLEDATPASPAHGVVTSPPRGESSPPPARRARERDGDGDTTRAGREGQPLGLAKRRGAGPARRGRSRAPPSPPSHTAPRHPPPAGAARGGGEGGKKRREGAPPPATGRLPCRLLPPPLLGHADDGGGDAERGAGGRKSRGNATARPQAPEATWSAPGAPRRAGRNALKRAQARARRARRGPALPRGGGEGRALATDPGPSGKAGESVRRVRGPRSRQRREARRREAGVGPESAPPPTPARAPRAPATTAGRGGAGEGGARGQNEKSGRIRRGRPSLGLSRPTAGCPRHGAHGGKRPSPPPAHTALPRVPETGGRHRDPGHLESSTRAGAQAQADGSGSSERGQGPARPRGQARNPTRAQRPTSLRRATDGPAVFYVCLSSVCLSPKHNVSAPTWQQKMFISGKKITAPAGGDQPQVTATSRDRDTANCPQNLPHGAPPPPPHGAPRAIWSTQGTGGGGGGGGGGDTRSVGRGRWRRHAAPPPRRHAATPPRRQASDLREETLKNHQSSPEAGTVRRPSPAALRTAPCLPPSPTPARARGGGGPRAAEAASPGIATGAGRPNGRPAHPRVAPGPTARDPPPQRASEKGEKIASDARDPHTCPQPGLSRHPRASPPGSDRSPSPGRDHGRQPSDTEGRPEDRPEPQDGRRDTPRPPPPRRPRSVRAGGGGATGGCWSTHPGGPHGLLRERGGGDSGDSGDGDTPSQLRRSNLRRAHRAPRPRRQPDARAGAALLLELGPGKPTPKLFLACRRRASGGDTLYKSGRQVAPDNRRERQRDRSGRRGRQGASDLASRPGDGGGPREHTAAHRANPPVSPGGGEPWKKTRPSVRPSVRARCRPERGSRSPRGAPGTTQARFRVALSLRESRQRDVHVAMDDSAPHFAQASGYVRESSTGTARHLGEATGEQATL
ncbi:collagen alpha-1(I) chain-like [Canis lupus familiaris]|uniref:collagen alpha-1(I) chain-like n=1 Tax=Canis lupus familiaris TaxID=9615 RepID=UPI0018F70E89|nr:collagen alpha-1(I) chain-like [Canis lupus familiaris]